MQENLPETRREETTAQSVKQDIPQDRPAGERKPSAADPAEVRKFIYEANKNPDDFE